MSGDVTGTWLGDGDDADVAPQRSVRSRGSRAGQQFPMRPYDPRQFPMRPLDPRQFPMRPLDPRQFPMRPYDPRQFPMRPYGRQFPMRPYDAASRPAGLDPDEWSADVSELFLAESALVRLGARVLVGDNVSVPAVEPLEGTPEYLPPLAKADPAKDAEPAPLARPDKKELAGLTRAVLCAEHELAVRVAIPDQLVRSMTEQPEVGHAIKQDIAHALAVRADQAFLSGSAGNDPLGISRMPAVHQIPAAGMDLLQLARRVLVTLRNAPQVRFGDAGWILHPNTIDGLSRLLTRTGQWQDAGAFSLDWTQLLMMDGHDGGTLLGYPFVATTAARDPEGVDDIATRIYFSTDWSEAWIAVDGAAVTVDVSVDADFPRDETVIRAVMRHDVAIRRPRFFAWAERPDGLEQVQEHGGADPEMARPPAPEEE
jgi:hypothetical protein